jgi:transcriptional regulator with GAF, ATPase, and Fis domain
MMGERTNILGRRKNGELFPAESSISKLPLDGQLILTTILRDITERKKTEEKLKETHLEIKQLKNQLEAENIYLREEIKLNHNFEEIISQSKALKQILAKIEQVATTDATVLILGETGTGKELIARAVHFLSRRKERPLVKVNCAAIPVNLIESELFGHEKGAFTGALTRKIGRFELASGGTIFLDEIGDLPLDLQAKLLRVIQEGEFERLGNSQTTKVNVRIIAATNRDLHQALKNGEFREDLYYRLNVFPLNLPPLRDRKEDIPLLVHHFVNKFSTKLGKQIKTISHQVMKELQRYNWPGNVRELENIIERAVILSPNGSLKISESLEIPDTNITSIENVDTLEELEKQHILKILEEHKWKIDGKQGAAKHLGLHPNTLRSRMRKQGIRRPAQKIR